MSSNNKARMTLEQAKKAKGKSNLARLYAEQRKEKARDPRK